MAAFTYTAAMGLLLLADEVGAWMAGTTAETLVGTELVVNGDFTTDTDWNKNSGWTIDTGTGRGDYDGTGTLFAAIRSALGFSLIAGKTYLLTFEVVSISASSVSALFRNAADSATIGSILATTVGTHSGYFIAESSTTIRIQANNAAQVLEIDNVSVRLAVPDLSANNNGLGVYGSIIKSAVNTGSGLMAYSGFSAANYLEQPYNSDLDFGTGDFCFMGWLKESPNTNTEFLFYRESASTAQNFFAYIDSAGKILFGVDDDTTSHNVTSDSIVDDGLWRHITFIYKASLGSLYIYVNSTLDASIAGSVLLTLDNSLAVLKVGSNILNTLPLTNGNLSLWRAFNYAPTAAQIKTIYDSEKILFRPDRVYTQVGEVYSLDIDISARKPKKEVVRNTSTTFDGSRKSLKFRNDLSIDITTLPVERLDFDSTRRFIDSVDNYQAFTLDIYGTLAIPYDPQTFYMESESYSEDTIGVDYIQTSFKVIKTE